MIVRTYRRTPICPERKRFGMRLICPLVPILRDVQTHGRVSLLTSPPPNPEGV